MASEYRSQADSGDMTDEQEEGVSRTRSIVFDDRLGPTCMVVASAIAIGGLILIMVIWGFQNFDKIYR